MFSILVLAIVVLAVVLDAVKKRLTSGLAEVNAESQVSGAHSVVLPPSTLPEPVASVASISTDDHESSHGDLSSSSNPKPYDDPPLPSGYEYEVFLSFRGVDTRKTFTDCLYRALVNASVNTFRDEEELRTGEEIGPNLLKAIKESKVYIPIFSKNYASSKWCLKELALMWECIKDGKHIILPVFLDVCPNEVQEHTEHYGRALQGHEVNYGSEVVQQWKEALTAVGHLKGMDLANSANGFQGKLIEFIVSDVLSKLKKAQLNVAEKLIGIDHHVKAFKQFHLQLGENDVRIVGILGMGGIGKTTLSKVIYNQIWGCFEEYSYIKDVRETSRRHGLEYLRTSLASGLSRCNEDPPRSADEGIHRLRSRYRGKKVLIVLDDISNQDQLDALLIQHNSFGQGSRLIITTRNKDVLDRADHIYEVKPMSEVLALELFCRHAFRKDHPNDELVDLSWAIAKSTGGLPLALEVIGSFLHGKKVAIWKQTLEKLKMVPNEEVLNKLRVSFEALGHEEKQIFLDIACFFIGEDISKILPMWEDSNFFPEIGIHVLVANSLIKIGDDDNKIWMHDQLRDLGREIVRQENYKQPGRRSRLWHSEEAIDVLANKEGSSNVEAIRVHNHKCCFTSKEFKKFSRLKFLDLTTEDDNYIYYTNDIQISGDFDKLLPRLKWLKWKCSSFNSLINLHLPNLVSLELSYNDLTDEWKSWSSIQMMKLKVLDLSFSKNLTRTPNFDGFPNLERLNLYGCHALEVIDPSIHKLKNLTYFNMSSSPNIRELPPELGSLEKLEFLGAYKCKMLTQIPGSVIGRLYHLQNFDVRHCLSLRTFYALTNKLSSPLVDRYVPLSTLDISGCGDLKLLPSLSNLKLLKSLIAPECYSLEALVGLDQLYALESLNITHCHSITRLPDLSKLEKLETINAHHCYKLLELPGLDELKALKELNISECRRIKKLPDLSKLKLLEELNISGCKKLQEFVVCGELNKLRYVNMECCRDISQLPDLTILPQLVRLNISGCEKVKELVGLGELERLSFLGISRCKQIEELPDLPKLQRLECLEAMGCKKLSLPALDKLENLKSLSIDWSTEIEILPDLSKLTKLEYFYD